jgi:hypothetical protein
MVPCTVVPFFNSIETVSFESFIKNLFRANETRLRGFELGDVYLPDELHLGRILMMLAVLMIMMLR